MQSFVSGIGNWIADEVLYQVLLQKIRLAWNASFEL
jgi:formamidopyrimidine-DNA glycosylase